jgi:hypothetical protein
MEDRGAKGKMKIFKVIGAKTIMLVISLFVLFRK